MSSQEFASFPQSKLLKTKFRGWEGEGGTSYSGESFHFEQQKAPLSRTRRGERGECLELNDVSSQNGFRRTQVLQNGLA